MATYAGKGMEMTNDPMLASTTIPSWSPRIRLTFVVAGGLHYMRGNSAPYFSLTYTSHRKGFPNQMYSGGAGHEEILKRYPRFADLAALHLSDINGVPMHAERNGWYDLVGALPDNAGERYHAGNSKRHFPKPAGAPRRGDWDNTNYRFPTPDECLQLFARHARVSVETAREVRDTVERIWRETRNACETQPEDAGEIASDMSDYLVWTRASWRDARKWFAGWIEEQKPRWKQEAEACIVRHHLRVYGDPWEKPRLEGETMPRTADAARKAKDKDLEYYRP